MPVTSVCEFGELCEAADVQYLKHEPTGKPSQSRVTEWAKREVT